MSSTLSAPHFVQGALSKARTSAIARVIWVPTSSLRQLISML